jgi:hypothetical protein
VASESQNKHSVAPLWIILFIIAGALILGYSATLEDHIVFKPILESLGDGLLLLGLIDLYLQNKFIAWLTKPSDFQEVLSGIKHATKTFGDTNQWVIDQQRSIQTHDNVDRILTEIRELKEQPAKPRP